ncbi:HEAT repeat domain-containing protein [Methanofervidicoccus abyssi]|nr:HEAT repeat domain-containing protein [Methanofervidicoccus abyssi]
MNAYNYNTSANRELSQLFLEYYKQDWKKRSEAARILGYINDQETIEKLTPYIVELALDTNRFIRINLAHSLKKIVLEYNIVNEDIFFLLYSLAYDSYEPVSSLMINIIKSMEDYKVIKFVSSISKKLGSSNNYEILYSLVSIGLISSITPEYLVDALPKLMLLANTNRYKIIQIIAVEILGEFKSLNREYLTELYYFYYIRYRYKEIFQNLRGDDFNKYFDKIKYYDIYLKKNVSKDDIVEVINTIKDSKYEYDDTLKTLKMSILYTHFKPLRELLNEDENLGKVLLEEVLNNIESDNFLVKLSAILLFSKIITVEKVYKNLSKNDIDNFFKVIEDNLVKGNYLLKGFSLEALCNLVKWGNSQYMLKKIEEVIDKVDMEKVMSEGYLCYYYGIYLMYYFKKLQCISARHSPNITKELLEKFRDLGLYKLQELIKSIYLGIKKREWLDRFYSGKFLGNILCSRIRYNPQMFEIVNRLLYDSNYLNRNIGIWLFRLIIEIEDKPPSNINPIIKTTFLFDDWYFGTRVEYLLFYSTLISKFPKNIQVNSIKTGLISTILTKCLTDKNRFIKYISRELFYKLVDDVSEYFELLDYHNRESEERISIIDKYIRYPETRKAAIMLIKNELERYIKNKKGDKKYIETLLRIIYNNICEETIYVLFEIIKLKKRNFPLSAEIVKSYIERYPKLPRTMADVLYKFVNEHVFRIRCIHLLEVLAYVEERIIIQRRILNRIKELVVYADSYSQDIKIAMKILNRIEEPECKAIVEEKERIFSKYFKDGFIEIHLNSVEIRYIPVLDIIEIMNSENTPISEIIIQILESEGMTIPKIMVLDYFINEIISDDNLLDEILSIKNIFDILAKLAILPGYSLISKKALTILEEISIKKSDWLKDNLISNFDKKSTPSLIKRLLKSVSSPFVELEIIEAYNYLIDKNMLKCSESKNMKKGLYRVIHDTYSEQPWVIFRKIVDIVKKCPELKEDREFLNVLSKKIMNFIEWETSPTAKTYLLSILEKLHEEEIEYVEKETINL